MSQSRFLALWGYSPCPFLRLGEGRHCLLERYEVRLDSAVSRVPPAIPCQEGWELHIQWLLVQRTQPCPPPLQPGPVLRSRGSAIGLQGTMV